MESRPKLLTIIGWALTIILQGTLALVMVFVISLFFPGLDITTRGGWISSLIAIWLGFTLGIFAGGWFQVRRRESTTRLYSTRLGWTALAVLLPLAILVGIGLRYDPSDGSAFRDFILNNWEPRLSQLSLWLGIIGYYLPDWILARAAARE